MSARTDEFYLQRASSIDQGRRRFSGAVAAGAAVATLPWFGSARAAAPRKGGNARVGVVGATTADALDPGTFNDTFLYMLGWALRNNLTELGPDGELVGELAQSWEPSADLTVWTFRLRDGVEFHNGKNMDAPDVVASLNYHRVPDSKSRGKGILADVEDIKADGRNIVVVRLKKPNADLPAILSDFPFPIMPAGSDGRAEVLSGVGTGGYTLQTFEPGVRAVLKRNPRYWKAGRAHFDSVELIGVADAAARTSGLRSSALDIMGRCDVKTASLLAKVPNVRLIELPSPKNFVAWMRVDRAPFDNVDVRLAVKHAVNRRALVDATLAGHGLVGNDHPIGPSYRYHATDIPQREYDPERAKFHLKKAGYDNLKLQLHTSSVVYSGAVDAAVLMKENARAAGIDIEVVQDPADTYGSNVWRQAPWCIHWFGGRATEGAALTQAYRGGSFSNASYWNNEKFNGLLDAALRTVEPDKRRELYREMQILARDDGGALVYAFATILDAHSTKIQTDEKISRSFELDGYRAIERWWFA
jgi:peptide/nickel transport system substrate-binding protein